MSQDTSKLKEQLRRLRIGDKLDADLDKAVAEGGPSFTLVYKPGQEPQQRSEFYLHYSLVKDGSYSLNTCDVTIYRPIEKLPLVVNGIRTSALEHTLAAIDWSEKMPSVDQQIARDDARESLIRMAQTPEGKKIAALLLARYWAEPGVLDDLPVTVEFDQRRQLYNLSHSFNPDSDGPIDHIHARVVGQMEACIPHMYQVELAVTDLSTGKSSQLVSETVFDDIGPAGQLFILVSPVHYDQGAMEQLQLPWKVEAASLYDRVDGMRVATKTVQNVTTAPNKPAIKIELDVNEQKMPILEFVHVVDILAFDDSIDKSKIEAVRQQFAPKTSGQYNNKTKARKQETKSITPKHTSRRRSK